MARLESGLPPVRVLCVDDHALLVEGLKAQFAVDGGVRVVGALDSAATLLDEVAKLKPDVVLLDIEMPGPDVFEVADRLHQLWPRVRTVFLSAHVRDGYIASAYRVGAWGYFAKSDELADIIDGVKSVGRSEQGAFLLGPKVRQRWRSGTLSATHGHHRPHQPRQPEAPSTPLDRLSDREVEVLRLIGRGRSRTEIARELCRSAKTIDGHQERILRKLGLATRSELLRFAIREGLAEV